MANTARLFKIVNAFGWKTFVFKISLTRKNWKTSISPCCNFQSRSLEVYISEVILRFDFIESRINIFKMESKILSILTARVENYLNAVN